MCNEHSKSPRKLWGLLNSLTGRVKTHPPPRATLNSLSETFAAIVSDPSRPAHLVQTAETETRCTSEPSHERRRLCQFSRLSVEMVRNLLQNIDSRKATGADGIPGLLLTRCASVFAPSLTAIFNASLAAGELPQAFKQAHITSVYKSGDRETASNYRPIFLLPIVSKQSGSSHTYVSKLRSIGISGNSPAWFSSYLSGRSIVTTVDHIDSEEQLITSGVPRAQSWAPCYSLCTCRNFQRWCGPARVHCLQMTPWLTPATASQGMRPVVLFRVM